MIIAEIDDNGRLAGLPDRIDLFYQQSQQQAVRDQHETQPCPSLRDQLDNHLVVRIWYLFRNGLDALLGMDGQLFIPALRAN